MLLVLALAAGAIVLAVKLDQRGLDYPGDSELGQRLNREIRRAAKGNGIVEVASATDFAWSRVYEFGPYTPPETINETIGFDWEGAEDAAPYAQDCEAVLVFVHGRDVPSWFFTRDANCKGLDADFQIPQEGIAHPGIFRLKGTSLTPVAP